MELLLSRILRLQKQYSVKNFSLGAIPDRPANYNFPYLKSSFRSFLMLARKRELCRYSSTIIVPFMTIQCPGKVQRYG